MFFSIRASAASCTGKVRNNNEDNLYFSGIFLNDQHADVNVILLPDGSTSAEPMAFGVFDGMGGHAKGELASYLMARRMNGVFGSDSEIKVPMDQIFRSICLDVNREVCDIMIRVGRRIGTTAAMLGFERSTGCVCNLGDSPVYRLRNGKMELISREHTERAVYEQINGKGSAHGRKFPLLQHIGIFPEEMQLNPYTSVFETRSGDTYLICSDGLTDMVPEPAIRDVLVKTGEEGRAVHTLVKMALDRGGRDNITIILIRIGQLLYPQRTRAGSSENSGDEAEEKRNSGKKTDKEQIRGKYEGEEASGGRRETERTVREKQAAEQPATADSRWINIVLAAAIVTAALAFILGAHAYIAGHHLNLKKPDHPVIKIVTEEAEVTEKAKGIEETKSASGQ